jgi:hypothetical protein
MGRVCTGPILRGLCATGPETPAAPVRVACAPGPISRIKVPPCAAPVRLLPGAAARPRRNTNDQKCAHIDYEFVKSKAFSVEKRA